MAKNNCHFTANGLFPFVKVNRNVKNTKFQSFEKSMINFHISKTHLLVCFKPQIQATRVVPDRTAVGLT